MPHARENTVFESCGCQHRDGLKARLVFVRNTRKGGHVLVCVLFFTIDVSFYVANRYEVMRPKQGRGGGGGGLTKHTGCGCGVQDRSVVGVANLFRVWAAISVGSLNRIQVKLTERCLLLASPDFPLRHDRCIQEWRVGSGRLALPSERLEVLECGGMLVGRIAKYNNMQRLQVWTLMCGKRVGILLVRVNGERERQTSSMMVSIQQQKMESCSETHP